MDERSETAASALGGVVFGLIVAALGAFFVVVLLGGARKAKDTRGWEETPCEITRSEIIEERPTPNSQMAYRAAIEYSYSFREQSYTGSRIKRVDGPTSHRKRAEKLTERYPLGAETSCWVDSANPSWVVLKHDTMAPLYTVWFPGLFVVAGIGIAVTAVLRLRG